VKRGGPKNVVASVQARLVERSRELDVEHQLTLARFGGERLLYRLSESEFADRFILKGAALLLMWLGELLHPEMASLYRQKVTTLARALEHPETRTEASEVLRGLIDAIVLTPNQGELQIELKGNLAAMLGAAKNAKRSPETGDLSLQVVMVAGACNQRYLQLWSGAGAYT
jgi:site-specific DNA recombinase